MNQLNCCIFKVKNHIEFEMHFLNTEYFDWLHADVRVMHQHLDNIITGALRFM